MNFLQMLKQRWQKTGSLLCVGLDSDYTKLPQLFKNSNMLLQEALYEFNLKIVKATADLVCAYKLNLAFYNPQHRDYGLQAIRALWATISTIKEYYPDIPVILDAKWGDISNTAKYYSQTAFDFFQADAVTVNPYLGRDTCQPFLERKDKGIFLLCRTSNSGAQDFQDLIVSQSSASGERHLCLYQVVADEVANKWNENNNCGLVMGATYSDELRAVRKIVGEEMTFLVPGIGKQGGDIKSVIKAGINQERTGIIINASRSIIFASSEADFAEAGHQAVLSLNKEINQYR